LNGWRRKVLTVSVRKPKRQPRTASKSASTGWLG